MKKLIYIIIGLLIIFNLKPAFITVNEQQTQQCTIDMQKDNTLICD